MLRKLNKRQELEEEPEYIIIDEYARVFSGLKEGTHMFSENIDDAKPLKGQSKFDYMKRCIPFIKIEQMFLKNKIHVRKKRRNRKIRISI
jgi:hypothetical protein